MLVTFPRKQAKRSADYTVLSWAKALLWLCKSSEPASFACGQKDCMAIWLQPHMVTHVL